MVTRSGSEALRWRAVEVPAPGCDRLGARTAFRARTDEKVVGGGLPAVAEAVKSARGRGPRAPAWMPPWCSPGMEVLR